MEFKTLIKERSACKKYDGRKIEKEKLLSILEAGRLAPTAKNNQEQKIYVLQKDEDLKKLDELTPCRYKAGTCLIVAFKKDEAFVYPDGIHSSGGEDAAIVATHMLLAAKNEGVDSCWLNDFEPAKVAEAFSLPPNEEVLMIMDLGYAAPNAPVNPKHAFRKDLSETVVFL